MKFRILSILFCLPLVVCAQVDDSPLLRQVVAALPADTVEVPSDTLAVGSADLEVYDVAMRYTQRLDSLTEAYSRWKYTGGDTLGNPFYSSLFSSPVLLQGTLRRGIGSLSRTYGQNDQQVQRAEAIDRALLSIYANRPWLVKREQADRPAEPEIPQTARPNVPRVRIEPDVQQPPRHEDLVSPDFNMQVHRPNFWTFKADLQLQFMQNYVSDNWYKGGESNNSMIASAVLEANYNNKSKLTFNNKLEMKLGFYTSKSDSLHRYKTNNDLLRMTNKLGLKATKHWSYTVMLQSWTQFYRGYKSNNPQVFSDFTSPLEVVLSLGMDYKLSVKRFNLSATLSPFALDYKYVGRKRLAKSFGIEEGHHSKLDYGSTVTVNATWTPFKNVTWKSRLYWFTDYSRTTVEWENTMNFKINEYLSTTLFLYPRFDDGVTRKDGDSYLQFKEYLSLGFSLSL